MPDNAILLADADLALMKGGEFLVVTLAGQPLLLGYRNGHARMNGHNGNGLAPATTTRPRRATTKRASRPGARVLARPHVVKVLEQVKAARNDFAALVKVAKGAGIALSRLRSWVKESGATWAPNYVCRTCRPPVQFDSGVGYSGHVRIVHEGKILRKR